MSGNLGFRTIVVSDATASFNRTGPDGIHWTADQVHSVSLANLHGEFATIVKTEQLLS
jgi:nicotinamidase-related amidase